MTEKLTIRDIARIAGVSPATVSRVLNNNPRVDLSLREHILRVVEEYHFIPDLSARQLRSRSAQPGQAGPEGVAEPQSHSLRLAFPPDFLWGVSTSAYQIEGATKEDGRGPSIWDVFTRLPGATYQGETGDCAADHYHRMAEDVELMAALNLKAYRFSLAWPRILPRGVGTVNARGLDFYDRLVDHLLAKQICPVVALYHWDLPLALQERGGWKDRRTAEAFAEYAAIAARRLGDRVSWWITLNEPWCSAYLGYGVGQHAPGERDLQAAVNAGHHLLVAHALATERLRASVRRPVRVGMALNLTPVSAMDASAAVVEGAERADVLYNRWFLDPLFRGSYPERLFRDLEVRPPLMEDGDLEMISAPLDFLGVNYYFRTLLRTRRQPGRAQPVAEDYEQVVPVPGATYTETAWEIYPQGVRDLLLRVQRDYAPPLMMVSENGAAFADQWDGGEQIPDVRRIDYLRDHIQELEKAAALGVPLGGYFVWSLLDNYEWTDGYSKRFGLVYVDYATQRRIVKESGRWYAGFIAAQARSDPSTNR
ncbi:MAG TPA: GH1 family beta-glucosidase [Ktedonobacteraceae bacterium]|nr:GH1 family beta-glucosidase [Ktedonobacteraceae bacterium]